jgi:hypothetical protein
VLREVGAHVIQRHGAVALVGPKSEAAFGQQS